jgi:hypothetical protein
MTRTYRPHTGRDWPGWLPIAVWLPVAVALWTLILVTWWR